MVGRAHIIETRLEEEQAALTKRQLGYQRQDKDKDNGDDEYEKYVHEAQFKIQVRMSKVVCLASSLSLHGERGTRTLVR